MLNSAEEIVHRRVVGARLVAVVEAVHPCESDPERQGTEEDEELERGPDVIDGTLNRVVDDRLRDEEGERKTDDVGSRERTPDDPPATVSRTQLTLVNEVARTLADDVQRGASERPVRGRGGRGESVDPGHGSKHPTLVRCP